MLRNKQEMDYLKKTLNTQERVSMKVKTYNCPLPMPHDQFKPTGSNTSPLARVTHHLQPLSKNHHKSGFESLIISQEDEINLYS